MKTDPKHPRPIKYRLFAVKSTNAVEPQPSSGKQLRYMLSRFENVRVYTLNFGQFKKGAAMTIPGLGIFVGPVEANDIDLLRHEFGHILQYRAWGFIKFWSKVVSVSLKSAHKSNKDWSYNHMHAWTEWSANLLSYQYFNQPTDWKLKKYPIWPDAAHPGKIPSFVTELF